MEYIYLAIQNKKSVLCKNERTQERATRHREPQKSTAMADNLVELAKRKVNVSITLTQEELQAIADNAAEKARRAVEAEYSKRKEQETYYTKNQVCKLLSVTPPTLWSWDKKGVLKAIRVGGLLRYKKSDIDRIAANA